jgi:hypothetical protein
MRFTVLRQIKTATHQNVVFGFIGGPVSRYDTKWSDKRPFR